MDMTGISQGFAQHDREWMGHTKGPVVRESGESIEDTVAIGIMDPRFARICEGRSGMIDNLAQIRAKGLTPAQARRTCRACPDLAGVDPGA